ncbi:MAG TPA: DUF1731 domain-containing protein [Pirellulaceae bacterium]|nr:DUF1731 domain-containing protein [Pirellulaceae bacterium]
MPIGLPAFTWMVKLGAPWLALYGRYVISQRLREQKFEFQFPQLRAALADLLTR